jgi:surface protein
MSDILQQIADNLGVGSYPPLNNSYLYAIADYYGVDTTTSKDLMADILTEVGGDPSTSSDYLKDIVLALGGTVTINGNWMEAWLAITAAPPAFAFTAKTDNTGVSTSTQFKLPLTTSTGLNIVVDWGDATTSTITSHTDPAVTHTYASAGTYSISITGTLPGFQFNGVGDNLKILNISSWGVLDITTNSAFKGCTNLTCTATDAPTISTTDLKQTFANCTNFNGNIGNWDTSGVNIMEGMLTSATAFNQPLNWDTSAVDNMFRMFRSASAFNQPLNWDTSAVTNMGGMFQNATAFNQNISAWDVSQVNYFRFFMTGKTFSNYDAANLDAIYNTWSLLSLQYTLTIDFGTIKYTAAGQTGKDDLIFNFSWTVNDGGI